MGKFKCYPGIWSMSVFISTPSGQWIPNEKNNGEHNKKQEESQKVRYGDALNYLK
ncbi:MAG: hypothetical protein ABJN84_13785 [Flavobacteriaceae bacterium]